MKKSEKDTDRILCIFTGVAIIEVILYGTYKFGLYCIKNIEWADVCF